MNRQQRRTRGKYILGRLTQLRNSSFVNDAMFKDIPKETIELLSKGKCENLTLQRQYNKYSRLFEEMFKLEYELEMMKADLNAKRQTQKEKSH